MYLDTLNEELGKINTKYPYVPEIVNAIHKINLRSNMEFDYDIEKTYLKSREIVDILKKHKIL